MEKQKEKSAREKILNLLKEEGRSSTTKIANFVKIDHNYALKILNELKEQKKVREIKETIATYWELRK